MVRRYLIRAKQRPFCIQMLRHLRLRTSIISGMADRPIIPMGLEAQIQHIQRNRRHLSTMCPATRLPRLMAQCHMIRLATPHRTVQRA